MYSVKPGRGPSLMGSIMGVFVAIFGIGWTITASAHGAPALFTLFGIMFVILAIGGVLYNMFNAASPNRMSTLDITTPGEESDPIADALVGKRPGSADTAAGAANFCPQCGRKAEGTFKFCPGCGRPL
jgi:hypothetical protein